MARRRLEGLERVLGVNALFATAYGNVGSSVYYALGLVASYALGLTPVVFIITGIFFVFTGATYAEATTMYPEAGGSSSFARHAFNEFWSFFAAWAQLLTYVATIAISAFFVPHYLGGLFWPALRHSPGDIIFGCGVIVVLGAINIVGVRESTGVNIVLAVVDFLTQLLLVIIGIILVLSPSILVDNVHFGVAPTWSNLLIALPIGMLAYTGIETVSNMSEEARDYASTVPAAISRVRIAVFAIYFTLPSVALSALPVYRTASGAYQTKLGVSEENGGFAGDPVLGVVKQLHLGVAQHAAETYVGLLAATILFLGTNAGLIGVSRLVYSMGVHRQMPDALRKLHPRFRTPWIGILVFCGFAILVCLPGQANFLGSIYSFGALLSWTIAHLAVTRLRFKLPDAERPYRGPGNWRVGGVDLPLFAIAGGSFTAIAFVVIVVLHPIVAVVGVGWLLVGTLMYAWFRHHHGLDLTSTHKVVVAHPVVDREVEYAFRADPGARWSLRRERPGNGRQARRSREERHPCPVPGHRSLRAADRRAPPEGVHAGGIGDQPGPGPGRPPSIRSRRADSRGAGGTSHHPGGHRDARDRDRDAAPASRQQRVPLREDRRVGARRPAVPGHPRVVAELTARR